MTIIVWGLYVTVAGGVGGRERVGGRQRGKKERGGEREERERGREEEGRREREGREGERGRERERGGEGGGRDKEGVNYHLISLTPQGTSQSNYMLSHVLWFSGNLSTLANYYKYYPQQ